MLVVLFTARKQEWTIHWDPWHYAKYSKDNKLAIRKEEKDIIKVRVAICDNQNRKYH